MRSTSEFMFAIIGIVVVFGCVVAGYPPRQRKIRARNNDRRSQETGVPRHR